MAIPPDASKTGESAPREPRGPRPIGRILALFLTILVTLALVAWTMVPRATPGSRVTTTITSGQFALTATESIIGCTEWMNGTHGSDLYAQFEYELENLGGSQATMSVIIALASNVSLRVVAEHSYTLGAHETVEGAISAGVPILGSCPATPLSLGLSTQGRA